MLDIETYRHPSNLDAAVGGGGVGGGRSIGTDSSPERYRIKVNMAASLSSHLSNNFYKFGRGSVEIDCHVKQVAFEKSSRYTEATDGDNVRI